MSVSAADRHASVLAPPESYLEVGFNFRMTDLQAAVGLVQLGRLPEMVARRRELAARYADAVGGSAGLRLVGDPDWGTTNFQSFWVEVLPELPARPRRAAGAPRRAPASRPAAASWPRTASRPTPSRTGTRRLPVTERLTDDDR